MGFLENELINQIIIGAGAFAGFTLICVAIFACCTVWFHAFKEARKWWRNTRDEYANARKIRQKMAAAQVAQAKTEFEINHCAFDDTPWRHSRYQVHHQQFQLLF